MFKCFKKKGEAIMLFLFFFFFYCFFQIKSIYGGDGGDLVTAAWTWGIPHPPGYPFYSLISSVLIHLTPLFTPAWRVGLISSFSSALTLVVFYLLLKRVLSTPKTSTARCATTAALVGTLTLAFLYPFWLYSELAEVFALNNLFVILLVYLFFAANGRKKTGIARYAPTAFFFILGLSLTHHHTVVLLFPAFIYLFIKNKNKFKFQKKQLIFYFLFFIFGLLFYIYPLLACRKTPLVCWNDPINFKNLVRLITRADYGTFKSSGSLGNAPVLRLYSLLSAFKLTFQDFTVLGIFLIILGIYRSYKSYRTNKTFALQFFMITLISCFFFIFYASFMLTSDFMVATFERFLIIPYIFLSLFLGIGASFVFQQAGILVKRFKLSILSQKIALTGLKMIIFILPLSIFISNFRKISILKNDMTAENMVKDFLTSLPPNSILITSSDTTVFNSQYVRYVLGFRDDVVVLSFPHLPAEFYKKALRKHFPELVLSDKLIHKKNLEEFTKANIQNYSIFVDGYKLVPEENWIPHGLTWQYLLEEDQLATASVVKKNLQIWAGFSDPLSGSLKEFKNLFLADTLRVYLRGRIDFGEYLIINGYPDEAREFFTKAQELRPDTEEVYIGLGLVSLQKGECQSAKEMFLKALEINEKNVLALGYLRQNELECFGNEEKAKEFEEQCVQIQEKKETSLEGL